MLDLYIIRHGESEHNVNPTTIGGRSNHIALSDNGYKQAELLAERLKVEGIHFDEIYSSPAVRAFNTSLPTARSMGYSIDDVVIVDDIQELDQGDWTGRDREIIYTPELIKVINQDERNFKAPNGESQGEVEERMLGWINHRLVSRYQEDLTVGLFTHGFAIKCLLRGILDCKQEMTYKANIDNTSITRLKYKERGWFPMCINDGGHLIGTKKFSLH